MTKKIEETRCTCGSCGHIWHYGKREVAESKVAQMHNKGKALMCCGGCLPAVLIKDKKPVDLNQCPKCGSRAVSSEVIVHDVE